jgi:hypothetical protein
MEKELYESIKQVLTLDEAKATKKGVIAKAARKGTPPFTVVVIDRFNKVVKQEKAQMADAIPAFVHELQKRYPKGDYKISVEDKGGRVVHSEEYDEVVEDNENIVDERIASPGSLRDAPRKSSPYAAGYGGSLRGKGGSNEKSSGGGGDASSSAKLSGGIKKVEAVITKLHRDAKQEGAKNSFATVLKLFKTHGLS